MELSLPSCSKTFSNINYSGVWDPHRHSLLHGKWICWPALRLASVSPAGLARSSTWRWDPGHAASTWWEVWQHLGSCVAQPQSQSGSIRSPLGSGGSSIIGGLSLCGRKPPSPWTVANWSYLEPGVPLPGEFWKGGGEVSSAGPLPSELEDVTTSRSKRKPSPLRGSPQTLSIRFDRYLGNWRHWEEGKEKQQIWPKILHRKRSSSRGCLPFTVALSTTPHPPLSPMRCGEALLGRQEWEIIISRNACFASYTRYIYIFKNINVYVNVFFFFFFPMKDGAYPRRRAPDITQAGAVQTSHCGSVNAPQSGLVIISGLSWWTEWCFYEVHNADCCSLPLAVRREVGEQNTEPFCPECLH